MPTASCPHCGLPLDPKADEGYPLTPMRCPSCRLVVASGRAQLDGVAAPGRGSAAAGVMRSAARRAHAEATSPERVSAALTFAAGQLSTSVLRLRMLDYEYLTRSHPDLPTVGTILATSSSWKQARRDVDDELRAGT